MQLTPIKRDVPNSSGTVKTATWWGGQHTVNSALAELQHSLNSQFLGRPMGRETLQQIRAYVEAWLRSLVAAGLLEGFRDVQIVAGHDYISFDYKETHADR